jgi:hypothetical protein
MRPTRSHGPCYTFILRYCSYQPSARDPCRAVKVISLPGDARRPYSSLKPTSLACSSMPMLIPRLPRPMAPSFFPVPMPRAGGPASLVPWLGRQSRREDFGKRTGSETSSSLGPTSIICRRGDAPIRPCRDTVSIRFVRSFASSLLSSRSLVK